MCLLPTLVHSQSEIMPILALILAGYLAVWLSARCRNVAIIMISSEDRDRWKHKDLQYLRKNINIFMPGSTERRFHRVITKRDKSRRGRRILPSVERWCDNTRSRIEWLAGRGGGGRDRRKYDPPPQLPRQV